MKRILSFFSLCLLAPSLFAANIFEPSQNDQSIYFLSAIFGNVGNVLNISGTAQESTLLKSAFLYFNNTVIVLGVILILYSLIVSVVNTSNDGEALGRKWNSVWIPLRSAMGFAMLLPVSTSLTPIVNPYSNVVVAPIAVKSYALIQVFIMWVIVQGVGAADYLWTNMVSMVYSGQATLSFDTSSTSAEMAAKVFGSMVCSISFTENQNMKNYKTQEKNTDYKKVGGEGNYGNNVPNVTTSKTGPNASTPNSWIWAFGSIKPTDWSRNSICGYLSLPMGNTSAGATPQDKALADYYQKQYALIQSMIGLPADDSFIIQSTQGHMGVYGGNWYGIYPEDGISYDSKITAGGSTGLHSNAFSVTYNDGSTVILPTVGYLADYYMVFLDRGAQPTDPNTDLGSTGTAPTDDPDGDCVPDDNGNGCSGVSTVDQASASADAEVRTQLTAVANAFQKKSSENYQAYSDALLTLQDDTTPGMSDASRKQKLVLAAQYNGWASAGAFFLDMVKVIQPSGSGAGATFYDYEYPSIACQKGIGIRDANAKRKCGDARTASDLKGKSRDGTYGHGRNTMGASMVLAESVVSDAMASADAYQEGTGSTGGTEMGTGTNCTPLYVTDDNGNKQLIQNCGIYNSTEGNTAFGLKNYKPRHFPYSIVDPVAWYDYVQSMIMSNFSKALEPLATMEQGSTIQNPLLLLRQSGLRLLTTSAHLYHIGLIYMWSTGLVSYAFSGITGILGAATSGFTWASSMYTALLAIMMSMGAVMAYYFPMIPYLVFTFATIQWLILTIEAMAAAPLLSLGILHPEGQHEVFGHSSMGIALLSSVFLRPSLMIIGYFAATAMLYVVVMLLNAGFFFANDALISSDSGTAGMFGTLMMWGIYLNALMIVINKAFTLIYHIPDHIMRWIGISEERTEVESMLGQVKQGVEKGAETGKGAADAEADARRQSMNAYGSEGKKAKDAIAKAVMGGPPV